MDNYFLDPILGLIIPGIGDVITCACTIPFIATTVFKLRSVSLTLIVIRNALIDALIGLFPILGDFFDAFNKSYKRSYNQIVGYVEGDEAITDEVDSGALKTCILITIMCIVIRLVVLLLAGVFAWFKGLFS